MCLKLMSRRHYRFFKKLDVVHKEEDRMGILFTRLSFIINLFKKNKRITILDDGCGNGELGLELSKLGFTIGIDPASRRIPEWKNTFKITFLSAAGDALPLKDECIDVIVSQQVIEHVEDVDQYLNEAYRVLKKRGILVISFPNKVFPIEGHSKLPFITYLPQSLFQIIMNAFAKRDYLVNRFTYKLIFNKVISIGFKRIYDATKEVLRKFFSNRPFTGVATHYYSFFKFVLPSWVWVCLK